MKKKSLTFRIFISTFLSGTIIYFICCFILIFNLYKYFEQQIFLELKTETVFLENLVTEGKLLELSSLETKNRITLIHSDGTAYFDNTVDFTSLENYSFKKEFVEAVKNGSASVSSFTSINTEKTLCYARQLSNGDIIRISCRQYSVGSIILGMSQLFLIMLIIAVAISGATANYACKKIINPLLKIDFENPEESNIYEELVPFTEKLAANNYEKTQREEFRKQFSANISHELKTPLTSIKGFAEILKDGTCEKNITADFANSIYDESNRMISLVNDIIKLSRMDEKSINNKKETFSLRKICREILNNLSQTAKANSITVNLKGDTGTIHAVRQIIYEMVYNLIDNAIKYNNPNGKVEITIKTIMSTKTVILKIADTGIGIPVNEKEHIFERFYRVDKSRSKEKGGTGLGLSIVKHAAKFHNASVLVNSEEGKGSTFTVIFPA